MTTRDTPLVNPKMNKLRCSRLQLIRYWEGIVNGKIFACLNTKNSRLFVLGDDEDFALLEAIGYIRVEGRGIPVKPYHILFSSVLNHHKRRPEEGVSEMFFVLILFGD